MKLVYFIYLVMGGSGLGLPNKYVFHYSSYMRIRSVNFDINSCVRNSNNITLSLRDVLPSDSLPILLSSLTQQPPTPLQTCMEGVGQQGVLKEYQTLQRLACSISSPAYTAEVG